MFSDPGAADTCKNGIYYQNEDQCESGQCAEECMKSQVCQDSLNVLNSDTLLQRTLVHRAAQLEAMSGGLAGFVAEQARRTEQLGPALEQWLRCAWVAC